MDGMITNFSIFAMAQTADKPISALRTILEAQ
jgi:hypothetical protein